MKSSLYYNEQEEQHDHQHTSLKITTASSSTSQHPDNINYWRRRWRKRQRRINHICTSIINRCARKDKINRIPRCIHFSSFSLPNCFTLNIFPDSLPKPSTTRPSFCFPSLTYFLPLPLAHAPPIIHSFFFFHSPIPSTCSLRLFLTLF